GQAPVRPGSRPARKRARRLPDAVERGQGREAIPDQIQLVTCLNESFEPAFTVTIAGLYSSKKNRQKRIAMIHVCSLAALPEIVRITGASHVLTVMRNVEQVQRPASVLEANHLRVPMDDITEPMEGYTPPSAADVEQVLNFVRGWDRTAPMV